jgi:DNA-binding NarL/FixJ family response regulator
MTTELPAVTEPEAASVSLSMLEDQALLRDALAEVLETSGIHVLGCFSEPSQFFAHLEAARPDVALVDLFSHDAPEDPSIGLALIRQIRQALPEVALLAFSAASDHGLVQAVREADARGFVHKYSTPARVLIGAIRALANGESYFQEGTPDDSSALSSISPREREVLACIAAGADNLKIAALLGITERTVKAHVGSLYRKLGSENRTQLALLARRHGLRPKLEI